MLFPESDSGGFPLCEPLAPAPPQLTRHMAKGVGGWVGRCPGTLPQATRHMAKGVGGWVGTPMYSLSGSWLYQVS